MANRPFFYVNPKNQVETKTIDFKWYAGMALSQAQKSIQSMHLAIKESIENAQILEISSKSLQPLGVKLSAFNLKFAPAKIQILNYQGSIQQLSVESAFQGSKVFNTGGPYTDIYHMDSYTAKKDERIRKPNQVLTGFHFLGLEFPLEPKTFFYDWLYLNALYQNQELLKELSEYNCFTDIAFNPQKSINCQAGSAALAVKLYQENQLKEIVEDFKQYQHFFKKDFQDTLF